MPWDVADVATEVSYDFHVAIPRESDTWVQIAKLSPGMNAILERVLNEAKLVYRQNEVETTTNVHWEQIKFTVCWLTFIESNMRKQGRLLFKKRKDTEKRPDRALFEASWEEMRPPQLTDEWTAAVLRENGMWYEMLQPWTPRAWMEKWLPDKMEGYEPEEEETEETEATDGVQEAEGRPKRRQKVEETLGEDSSE